MSTRGFLAPRFALPLFASALALAFQGTVPALASTDSSTPPSVPKHTMNGNNALHDKKQQKVPAPGKAAGPSYPATPPVPTAH